MLAIAKPKLSEEMARKIRELIMEQRFQPGDRFLSETILMGKFNVCRSTIREAIKLLAAENVVEIHHGKGTFICQQPGINSDPLGLYFTDQNRLLLNLFETRMIVEPKIAFLAAKRASDEDVSRLERIITAFKTCGTDSEPRFPALDVDFHSALAHCTKNDVLYRFLPSICDSIWKGRRETEHNAASHKKAGVCHRKIFEAVRDHKPEAAQTEMIKHIKETAKDMNIFIGGVL